MGTAYLNNRIIAFVDILGFKKKVENASNDALEAEKLHNALKRINTIKKENDGKGIYNRKSFGVEVNTFSDSAVISYPAEKDNLLYIILDLIYLQLDLVLNNVLIRGAVTIGDLYHDGDIVYGPAMNYAYKLESEVAIYPRIIVDVVALGQYLDYVGDDKYSIQNINSLIKLDRDGLYYVDMLKQDQEMTYYGNEYYEWLLKIREIIKTGLKEKDITVSVKYKWLKQYYNEVVTDENAYFPIPEDELYDDKNVYRNKYTDLKI